MNLFFAFLVTALASAHITIMLIYWVGMRWQMGDSPTCADVFMAPWALLDMVCSEPPKAGQ